MQKGDTVTVVAPGYYPQAVQNSSFAFSFAGFVAGLLQQPAGAPGRDGGRRGALPLLSLGVSAPLAALAHTAGVPQGYVRLLVFDADSNLVSSQVQTRQLSAAAASGYEPLTVQVIAAQDGYVTAYVSNADVYFDDVQVTLGPGLQVQETAYDPAGLELAGLVVPSPGIQGLNHYRFNSKEFQADLGLNWNHQDWRFYDNQVGRWHAVDPLADNKEWLTPYNFVQNNPTNKFDPSGLTDFTLERKAGEVKQVGEANKQSDRILKTNSHGEVKTKKNGEARVAVGGIEQGILKDGQNFNNQDNIIQVGGEGQPSVEGVKSFALQLSEYVGKEIKGYSYSGDASGNVTDILLAKYKKNSLKESYGTLVDIIRKYGDNYSANNVLQDFHTHPNGQLGATQSAPNLSADVTTLQNDKPQIPNVSFIILYRATGQAKPEEYDYTHEYKPRKK